MPPSAVLQHRIFSYLQTFSLPESISQNVASSKRDTINSGEFNNETKQQGLNVCLASHASLYKLIVSHLLAKDDIIILNPISRLYKRFPLSLKCDVDVFRRLMSTNTL